MSTERRQPNWFLQDGRSEIGPLDEVELRKRLVEARTPDLDRWRVRQGSSAWHPAQTVLNRFKELAQSGIYLRRDGEIEGPFTSQRAIEIIRSSPGTAVDVRNGLSGDWRRAADFLREQEASQREPETPSNSPSAAPKFRAVLIEDTQPVLQTRWQAEPIPEEPEYSQTAYPTPLPQQSSGYVRPIQTSSRSGKTGRKQPRMPNSVKIFIGVATLFTITALGGIFYITRDNTLAAGADEPSSVSPSADNSNERSPSSLNVNVARSTTAPLLTAGIVFRPSFGNRGTFFEAGTAFAARLPGSNKPIILSALHLFGPAGGLAADVPPNQLPLRLDEVKLTDCMTTQPPESYTGKVLVLANTKPFPESSPMGDVIAFMPHRNNQLRPLQLTSVEPKAGERVWMFSEVLNGPETVHAATVEGYEDGWMLYRFDNPDLEIVATSGAPVVNAKREVVAINAGGGEDAGKMLGVGTPAARFIEPLAVAAGLR